MSRLPKETDQPAQDYIVEYRAGQFQNGSLVLRFSGDPDEKTLRAALQNFGLPASALEEVRARPLNTGRMWDNVSTSRDTLSDSRWPQESVSAPTTAPTSAPTVLSTPPRRRPRLPSLPTFIVIAALVFVALGFQAIPAKEQGQGVGELLSEDSPTLEICGDALTEFGAGNGGPRQLLSDEPTQFPFTPANAAFFISCVLAVP
ncbi:hypothetical protein [Corynebacterium alimapuense]|uniref:Uncharacterized protein n=1 Tax=Corynebacterium alimapuense TaxID=1576874 RepID=A0A3M8K7H5_9CORY|nr:hypothetical protein [Corynebacterium alimapuense]RNE49181.1 hypothetical protein C5L39_02020 [Corynebacterium alimapuense]